MVGCSRPSVSPSVCRFPEFVAAAALAFNALSLAVPDSREGASLSDCGFVPFCRSCKWSHWPLRRGWDAILCCGIQLESSFRFWGVVCLECWSFRRTEIGTGFAKQVRWKEAGGLGLIKSEPETEARVWQ